MPNLRFGVQEPCHEPHNLSPDRKPRPFIREAEKARRQNAQPGKTGKTPGAAAKRAAKKPPAGGGRKSK